MMTAPSAADPGLPAGPQELSPGIVPLWRLRAVPPAALVTLLAAVPGAVAEHVVAAVVPMAVVAVVAGVTAWRLPVVAHRRWRYEVTDTTVELRHGVVLLVESSIPHFRVQHVDLRQGPIERWLGLARLEISTASSATDATIPGIDAAHADLVRRHVLERAETAEGV
jgi:uncharacterized protein